MLIKEFIPFKFHADTKYFCKVDLRYTQQRESLSKKFIGLLSYTSSHNMYSLELLTQLNQTYL